MRLEAFTLLWVAVASFSPAQAAQVTSVATDGIKLSLGNHWQQVELRVKSMGPGACAIKYSLGNGNNLEVLAPPLVWSKWLKFPVTYGGSTHVTLREHVVCDTGVIAEIRYHR